MAEKKVVTEVSPPPADHKIKHKAAVNGGDCDGSEAKQPRLEDKPDDLDFNKEAWAMTSIRGSFSQNEYMGSSGERKGKVLEVEDEGDDAAPHEYRSAWDDESHNHVRAASPPPPVYNWDIPPPYYLCTQRLKLGIGIHPTNLTTTSDFT